jgi:hypothetical protein
VGNQPQRPGRDPGCSPSHYPPAAAPPAPLQGPRRARPRVRTGSAAALPRGALRLHVHAHFNRPLWRRPPCRPVAVPPSFPTVRAAAAALLWDERQWRFTSAWPRFVQLRPPIGLGLHVEDLLLPSSRAALLLPEPCKCACWWQLTGRGVWQQCGCAIRFCPREHDECRQAAAMEDEKQTGAVCWRRLACCSNPDTVNVCAGDGASFAKFVLGPCKVDGAARLAVTTLSLIPALHLLDRSSIRSHGAGESTYEFFSHGRWS